MTDPFVPLVNGPVVPASVIAWLVEAEDRKITIHVKSDGRLFVGPRAVVTEDDLAFLRANKAAVAATLQYLQHIDAGDPQ